jgi:hypothetical protein
VCSLHSEQIQTHLLSEKDPSMASALEKAQNLETAHQDTQVLKGQTVTLAVGQLSDHRPPRRSPGRTRRYSGDSSRRESPCHRCGGTNHSGQDCRFRDLDCHCCGKKGHLAKVCRSTRVSGKGARKATRWVDTESPDKEPSEDILCHVHTVD